MSTLEYTDVLDSLYLMVMNIKKEMNGYDLVPYSIDHITLLRSLVNKDNTRLINLCKKTEKIYRRFSEKTSELNKAKIRSDIREAELLLKRVYDEMVSIDNIKWRTDDEKKWWFNHFGDSKYIDNEIFLKKLIDDFGPFYDFSMVDLLKYLDFCDDGKVSIFEFSTFMKWFAPLNDWVNVFGTVTKQFPFCGFQSLERMQDILKNKKGYSIRFSRRFLGYWIIGYVDDHGTKHQDINKEMTPIITYLTDQQFIGKKHVEQTSNIRKDMYFTQADFDNMKDEIVADGESCTICLDNEANIIFIPCGHTVVCSKCVKNTRKYNKLCPICKRPVTEYNKC